MRMVGHKTEAIYRRYRIVDEQDLRDAPRRAVPGQRITGTWPTGGGAADETVGLSGRAEHGSLRPFGLVREGASDAVRRALHQRCRRRCHVLRTT